MLLKARSFEEGTVYFEKLASASEVIFLNSKMMHQENVVSVVTKGGEMLMPLLDLVGFRKRIRKIK